MPDAQPAVTYSVTREALEEALRAALAAAEFLRATLARLPGPDRQPLV